MLYGMLTTTCRTAVWPDMQEPQDDLSITLWDARKQFGGAVRGLECIEADGSPVTFEVTGFAVSSRKARANIRLLGIQSEKDGSLVLAVRKPYISLHSNRQRGFTTNCIADESVVQISERSQDVIHKYLPRSKIDEVDVPLHRALRLRGHVKVIRT